MDLRTRERTQVLDMQSCSFCGHVDRSKPRKLCRPSPNTDCCSICTKLDHLNAEIAREQAFIRGLLDQMDGLRAELNHAHPSIIHRLPLEVAAIIFTFYASDVSGRESPFTLGAVCQRWREIAWSTPSVWTTLDIHFSKNDISQTHIRLVEEWLDRSGKLPLSITFNGYALTNSDSILHPFYPLIDIINQHCNQWYSLDLTLPPLLLAQFDDSACVSFIMHKLLLYSSTHFDVIDTLSVVAPQIVDIYGISRGYLNLNWICITDITMYDLPGAGDVLQILRLGPSLRNCKFSFLRLFGEDQPPLEANSHVTHPMVESLDIEFGFVNFPMQDFFKSITFPALKHLCIRSTGRYWQVVELIPFLTRSSSSLKSLVITEWVLTGEDLARITRCTPSLESLEVVYSSVDDGDMDSFFHALASHIPTKNNTIPSSTEPLLPSLQRFDWLGIAAFPWELVPLFFVPLSQNDSTCRRPLKTIKVHYAWDEFGSDPIPYIDRDILWQLSEFADEVQFQFETTLAGDSQENGDLWKMSLERSNKEENEDPDEEEEEDDDDDDGDKEEEEDEDDLQEEEG